MDKPSLITLACSLAASHSLDSKLVCAIIEQESGWNTKSVRLEQGFYLKYVRPLNLPPLESVCRSTSWGLMQVMGQVAREHNHVGALDELCTPAIGIDVGCIVLKSKLARVGGDLRLGLLRWNGGANPNYPDEVLARVSKYK